MATASIISSAINAPGIEYSRYGTIITIPATAPQAAVSISRSVGSASVRTSGLSANSSTVTTPVRNSKTKTSAAERTSAK